MTVRVAVASAVLVWIVAIALVLVWRMRETPIRRLVINLLFPASQLGLVSSLLCYAIVFDLPTWLFSLAVVVGLLCGPADLALFKAVRESDDRKMASVRVRALEEQMEAQREYAARLGREAEAARRVELDVCRELEAAEDLLASGDAAKAASSLMRAVGDESLHGQRFCEHRAVDALLALKAQACEKAGVRTAFEVSLSDDVALPDVEVCAIFSNLLDNALHACKRMERDDLCIELKASVVNGFLVVKTENPCVDDAPRPRRLREGVPEHGWGLRILDGLARRHGGAFETERADGSFRATVMLSVGSSGAAGRNEGDAA